MLTGQRTARRQGTCELCGAHNRELRILAIGDFIGWVCEICRLQLMKSQPRIWCGTGEETEPGE